MVVRIAIAEDDPEFLQTTKEYLDQAGREMSCPFVIDIYTNGAELVEGYRLKNCRYDILLLDIDMPVLNGMNAARQIRKMDGSVVIIFLTQVAGLALRGYEVGTLDFVVKPVSWPVFSVKIKRVVRRLLSRQSRFVMLFMPGEIRKIAVDDLYYAEVSNHRLYVHTAEDTCKVNKTLTEFENELNDRDFARCNSGILVHLKYVAGLTVHEVKVAGDILPVSRGRYKSFLKELTDYVGRNG